jgi:hypothetical protein
MRHYAARDYLVGQHSYTYHAQGGDYTNNGACRSALRGCSRGSGRGRGGSRSSSVRGSVRGSGSSRRGGSRGRVYSRRAVSIQACARFSYLTSFRVAVESRNSLIADVKVARLLLIITELIERPVLVLILIIVILIFVVVVIVVVVVVIIIIIILKM